VNIDVHAHLFPQSALGAEQKGQDWYGIRFERPASAAAAPAMRIDEKRVALGSSVHREAPDERLKRMDALGVDMQVVSLVPPMFRYDLDAGVGAKFARAVNDEIAGMVSSHPDRFTGLATLPLQDANAALGELEHALNNGLSGIAIGSHVNGKNLDASELLPIFQLAGQHELFVLCHPISPRAPGAMRDYYLSNLVGNPWESMVAFGSLMFGGVFDEAGPMNICFCHGGGYITGGVGRLTHGHTYREEAEKSARLPIEYMQSVYFDSLTHDASALRRLIDVVGADRVLLGSDYPSDMAEPDPVGFVSGALSGETRSAVLGGNAGRLFGIAAKAAR
jgi:aminocarboxymuconate-semialdehyde decarboxylase